jgi:hypothetical protein
MPTCALDLAFGNIAPFVKSHKKYGSSHPTSNNKLEFFIWGVTYLLQSKTHMFYTDRREWSAIVT